MVDISNVNDAKALAASVDEIVFAETALIMSAKDELAEYRVQFDIAKTQFDGTIGNLEAIHAYFEQLSGVLAENALPHRNEDGAQAIAFETVVEAKAMHGKMEEILGALDHVAELLKEAGGMATHMTTDMTALNGQILNVIRK